MAEMALWIRGVERVAPRTVRMVGTNMLDLYRTFVTIVTLTRSLVDRCDSERPRHFLDDSSRK